MSRKSFADDLELVNFSGFLVLQPFNGASNVGIWEIRSTPWRRSLGISKQLNSSSAHVLVHLSGSPKAHRTLQGRESRHEMDWTTCSLLTLEFRYIEQLMNS
jgi:hypothetical protein